MGPESGPPYLATHILWVMEIVFHKLGTATEASLLLDAAKPGPSDIFYLQESVSSLS